MEHFCHFAFAGVNVIRSFSYDLQVDIEVKLDYILFSVTFLHLIMHFTSFGPPTIMTQYFLFYKVKLC